MIGDVPGKVLVALGAIIAAALLYLGATGTFSYMFWGLSIILIILGLINWGVK